MTPQRSDPRDQRFAIPARTTPRRWAHGSVTRARLFSLAPVVLASGLFAAGCGSSPSPSSVADSLVSQGLQAESTGQFQLAAADFRSAAAKDHSDAVPYYELGALYERSHDTAKAVAAYKQALSIDPKYRSRDGSIWP